MCYSIKVTANKAVFGEMFQIEKGMNVNCVEDEMRAVNVIAKVFRPEYATAQSVEVYDAKGVLRGRIERDWNGAITVYAYRSNMLYADITEVWHKQEEHRLRTVEARNIIHLQILEE